MSREALRKLWSFFGLVSCGFAAAFVFRAAAAETDAGWLPLESFGPYGMTLVAIPVGVCLALLLLWLTRRHAEGASGGWSSRLPLFHFDATDIDPEHPDGKKYQSVLLVAFVVFPVLGQVLLLGKMLTGSFEVGGVRLSRWRHLWPGVELDWGLWWRGGYLLDGVTYFPWLQAWVYVGLILWLLVSFARTLWALFGGAARPPSA